MKIGIMPSAMPSRIDDVQSFQGCNRAERLVRNDEVIHQSLRTEVQCHRKLDRVQSTQTARESVLAKQALGYREMLGGQTENFDFTCREIEQQSGALHTSSIFAQEATSDFHRDGGLNLQESQAGDANLSARLRKDSDYSRSSNFSVIVFDCRTGIEKIVRQSIVPAFRDYVVGKGPRNRGKRRANFFNSGTQLQRRNFLADSFEESGVLLTLRRRIADGDFYALKFVQRKRLQWTQHAVFVDSLNFMNHTSPFYLETGVVKNVDANSSKFQKAQ